MDRTRKELIKGYMEKAEDKLTVAEAEMFFQAVEQYLKKIKLLR